MAVKAAIGLKGLMKKGHKLYDKLQSQLPDDVILEDRLH